MNADLEEMRELGSGTFGTVYHGKWRGTDVAIKRIKASCFAGRPAERDRLVRNLSAVPITHLEFCKLHSVSFWLTSVDYLCISRIVM